LTATTLTPESKPVLRWPLDVSTGLDSKTYILRDQQGVALEAITVPSAAMAIISRFDGSKTISQIANDGSAFGITVEIVLNLAQELERRFYLQSPLANARWELIVADFKSSPVREAVHAGLVYPSDPTELRQQIQQYLANSEPTPLADLRLEKVTAMITPHIDYHRGWRSYGAAYKSLEGLPAPDVIFLIGTAHQASRGFFHLSQKAFATPFGALNSDQEVISQLARLSGSKRLFEDEILHKREHSLELQLPFIHFAFSQQTLPRLVPILVGSFHHLLQDSKSPREYGEVGEFIGALAETIKSLRSSGRRVLLYGGVDLAHVGQHFGDQIRVSDSGLEKIEERDRELLARIIRGDHCALFEHIAEDQDARRICGFPSIYTQLAALELAGVNIRGHTIDYRQAVDRKNDCVVSFASAVWEEL